MDIERLIALHFKEQYDASVEEGNLLEIKKNDLLNSGLEVTKELLDRMERARERGMITKRNMLDFVDRK